MLFEQSLLSLSIPKSVIKIPGKLEGMEGPSTLNSELNIKKLSNRPEVDTMP